MFLSYDNLTEKSNENWLELKYRVVQCDKTKILEPVRSGPGSEKKEKTS